ncbi:hypothetical protein AURDEDRAFT_128951 [Auricularia subglabra TFB-10046 SS5]|nr:hypothetical protein AURDEDRAFT_128951 [Auricularia subglabra TFB-10046 SS5]
MAMVHFSLLLRPLTDSHDQFRARKNVSPVDVAVDDTPPERLVTGPWWKKKKFPRSRRSAANAFSSSPAEDMANDEGSASELSLLGSPAENAYTLGFRGTAENVPRDVSAMGRSTESQSSRADSRASVRSSAPSSRHRSPTPSPTNFSNWPRPLHQPFQTVARVPGRLGELIGIEADLEQALNILYKLPAAEALAALQEVMALDVIDAAELVLAQLYDTRDMLN